MTGTAASGDRTPPRTILSVAQIDDLGAAIIALTREVWVLTDRLAVVEAVLGEHGVDMARVESYQPDAAMAERLDARRQALIDQVLTALGVERAEPAA